MIAESNKDPSILDLLARLRTDLGDDAFDIVDHWGADLTAIGLACPSDHRMLAYISTDNQLPDSYSYELELPPTNDDELYSVTGESSRCTYPELLDALCLHWKIVR